MLNNDITLETRSLETCWGKISSEIDGLEVDGDMTAEKTKIYLEIIQIIVKKPRIFWEEQKTEKSKVYIYLKKFRDKLKELKNKS